MESDPYSVFSSVISFYTAECKSVSNSCNFASVSLKWELGNRRNGGLRETRRSRATGATGRSCEGRSRKHRCCWFHGGAVTVVRFFTRRHFARATSATNSITRPVQGSYRGTVTKTSATVTAAVGTAAPARLTQERFERSKKTGGRCGSASERYGVARGEGANRGEGERWRGRGKELGTGVEPRPSMGYFSLWVLVTEFDETVYI